VYSAYAGTQGSNLIVNFDSPHVDALMSCLIRSRGLKYGAWSGG
jgi:hypothetical protein